MSKFNNVFKISETIRILTTTKKFGNKDNASKNTKKMVFQIMLAASLETPKSVNSTAKFPIKIK